MSSKKPKLVLPDGTLPLPKLSKRILDIGRRPKKRRKNRGNYKQRFNQIRREVR